MKTEPVLFALEGSEEFGGKVASHLGIRLAEHEERHFEDGEHKARPLEGVRERDVYVLHTLYGDQDSTVNDKLIRLLFFVATLKDAGARNVTALMPYLAYARKDRRTKDRDPVTTRYVGQLFEAMGVDCVAALEVHNRAAFDNAFRCRAEHLEAHALFVEELKDRIGDDEVVIVSPDSGGAKRADRFRDVWEDATGNRPANAFMEKRRSEGVVSGEAVVGDVSGKAAIIVDDLVAGGTTLLRAAKACKEGGATRVYGVITHALFGPGSEKLYDAEELDELLITDSVKAQQKAPSDSNVTVVSAADLFARAIRALNTGEDTSALRD
ncbi:ribose-phosphate pyrophosphokinase [Marinobacter daqiaonensis]|uniref:ribose-phosphate diphosphokinase n=1 Tax=Marinobacter daqiaonensis TaxID=650891 RepID=A0A1I6H7H7_9GAMM|nr:ribose-phosphate diphosphokinase [Marinobacter daqiaonensis]SFR50439.1 ribose-phosphate pyrophosphokinase [Marinobacter daqiaonensis]